MLDTHLQLYKAIATPAGLYGVETWTMTVSDRSRIQVAEMLLYRGLDRVAKRDYIGNEVIRKNLQVRSIHKSTDECKNG